VHLALLASPLLGAAAAYLIDGVSGSVWGFVIPRRPLVVVWLFEGR
jgi:hypothetical protein